MNVYHHSLHLYSQKRNNILIDIDDTFSSWNFHMTKSHLITHFKDLYIAEQFVTLITPKCKILQCSENWKQQQKTCIHIFVLKNQSLYSYV